MSARRSNGLASRRRGRVGRSIGSVTDPTVRSDVSGPLRVLVYSSDAKLAQELFDRPEAQKYLAEERFSSLSKEAKNQAMD